MSRKQTERNEGFQAELEDLQRKFRTLETDRKARSDNIGTSGSKAQQQVWYHLWDSSFAWQFIVIFYTKSAFSGGKFEKR